MRCAADFSMDDAFVLSGGACRKTERKAFCCCSRNFDLSSVRELLGTKSI